MTTTTITISRDNKGAWTAERRIAADGRTTHDSVDMADRSGLVAAIRGAKSAHVRAQGKWDWHLLASVGRIDDPDDLPPSVRVELAERQLDNATRIEGFLADLFDILARPAADFSARQYGQPVQAGYTHRDGGMDYERLAGWDDPEGNAAAGAVQL